MKSECGRFIYHICIIDYLQSYRLVKFGELCFRRTFQNAKLDEVSVNPPGSYATRFVEFFKNKVFIDKFGAGIS